METGLARTYVVGNKEVPVRNLRPSWPVLIVVGLLLASCGGSDQAAVPTPAQLAEGLLTADDLGGDWVLPPDAAPGILPDEAKAELPTLDLCEEAGAEARAAAAGLDWQVGTGFALGEAPEGGFTPSFLELALAGEPDQIATTFTTVRNGLAACIGTQQFIQDGGDFAIEAVPLPGVGDDRIGLRWRQLDQPEGSDRWDVRLVLIRAGAVIVWINEVEVNPTGQPVVGPDELAAIAAAAVEKLP